MASSRTDLVEVEMRKILRFQKLEHGSLGHPAHSSYIDCDIPDKAVEYVNRYDAVNKAGGHGIPSHTLSKIHKKMFLLETSDVNLHSGRGLLLIVKAISTRVRTFRKETILFILSVITVDKRIIVSVESLLSLIQHNFLTRGEHKASRICFYELFQ